MTLESRLQGELRDSALRQQLPVAPSITEIVRQSRRRRRRSRSSAVLLGLAAIAGVGIAGSRLVDRSGATQQVLTVSSPDLADPPSPRAATASELCPPGGCSIKVINITAGYVAMVTGRPTIGETDVDLPATAIAHADSDGLWEIVENDLPPDFTGTTIRLLDGRYLIGGSMPSEADSRLELPAVASSRDLSRWTVEVLGFPEAAPDGFHYSSRLEKFFTVGDANIAVGSAVGLVPDREIYGDATVCASNVSSTMVSLTFCDGDNVEIEVGAAAATVLVNRATWRAENSTAFMPTRRTDRTTRWDIFAASNRVLVAMARFDGVVGTSASSDGRVWGAGADLRCSGDAGNLRWPPIQTSSDLLVVLGTCDDELTMWTSTDDASSWEASQPLSGAPGIDPSGAEVVATAFRNDTLAITIVTAPRAGSEFVTLVYDRDGNWRRIELAKPASGSLLVIAALADDHAIMLNSVGGLTEIPFD